MSQSISPYHKPGFYTRALAAGRHRDIVGGRWDETGRVQMQLLLDQGLQPHHHLLDIGCGSLRLGCKAVGYLDPAHYWGTDLSAALMHRGYETELDDQTRLPRDHLIEDADFAFAGIPDLITHAICFAVFTHLPHSHLQHALKQIHHRFPKLEKLLFTVFIAPDADSFHAPFRQPDGVVSHPERAPYHQLHCHVVLAAETGGFALTRLPARLPRGQILYVARPRTAEEMPNTPE
jgi:hypothetical protein